LTFGNGLTLAAGATLALDLLGTAPGQSDRVVLSGGGVTLDGATLTLNRAGAAVAVGQTFVAIQGGVSGGAFAQGSLVGSSGVPRSFAITYGPADLVLTDTGSTGPSQNQPPVLTLPPAQALRANTALTIAGIGVQD